MVPVLAAALGVSQTELAFKAHSVKGDRGGIASKSLAVDVMLVAPPWSTLIAAVLRAQGRSPRKNDDHGGRRDGGG